MSDAMRQLPQYQCHKKVWALKISEIEGDTLVPEDKAYAPIKVGSWWIDKHRPTASGYWVQYEGGYTSFSPAEAFESGYSRIE